MKEDLSNIAICFKEDSRNNPLFAEYSLVMDNEELKELINDSLNIAGIAVFKKTPIVTLIDRFVCKIKNKYTDNNIQIIVKFIAFILLSLADPSFFMNAKRLKIIDSELFSNIESMFKRDEFGRKYILKNQLSTNIDNDDIDNLFSHLVNDQLLITEEDRYFINDDFVLMGVKIKT